MILRDHVHDLRPFSTFDRPDGRREVSSRCECGPGTVLESKLVYDPATGAPFSLRYRFGGLWFDPVDLVRLRVPFEECAACGGEPPAVQGAPPCGTCGGVGVTVGGAAVRPAELTTA